MKTKLDDISHHLKRNNEIGDRKPFLSADRSEKLFFGTHLSFDRFFPYPLPFLFQWRWRGEGNTDHRSKNSPPLASHVTEVRRKNLGKKNKRKKEFFRIRMRRESGECILPFRSTVDCGGCRRKFQSLLFILARKTNLIYLPVTGKY
ncbi:hypothetical protein AVEN_143236-1 [Araneus ventricosus]|uniref:Uncharacterized protein n=1 Tax=Araneus ventricosus TaxID=182803 RepID=A0A4Y2ADG6_ARAVE|nr:hypothetical protein AVEN_143236-1 [Araneus ventricosus]